MFTGFKLRAGEDRPCVASRRADPAAAQLGAQAEGVAAEGKRPAGAEDDRASAAAGARTPRALRRPALCRSASACCRLLRAGKHASPCATLGARAPL